MHEKQRIVVIVPVFFETVMAVTQKAKYSDGMRIVRRCIKFQSRHGAYLEETEPAHVPLNCANIRLPTRRG